MILGIVGLVCCGPITGVPATILGHLAKQEIAAAGGRESGSGMAQAGFVMGSISIALTVLGIVAWIFFVAAAGSAGFSGSGSDMAVTLAPLRSHRWFAPATFGVAVGAATATVALVDPNEAGNAPALALVVPLFWLVRNLPFGSALAP